MRKTLPFIGALVAICAIWNVSSVVAPEVSNVFRPFAQVKAEEMSKSKPVKVTIPSIGLSAKIISVGINEKGRMVVPPDNKTVSWWQPGVAPGEYGSAVLAGHFKVESGEPGVFFNLNKIKVGHEIEILGDRGEKQKFVVRELKIFKEEDFPVNEVYAAKGGRYLNLITCTGKFLKNKNDYSHRLVVYAEKVS